MRPVALDRSRFTEPIEAVSSVNHANARAVEEGTLEARGLELELEAELRA